MIDFKPISTPNLPQSRVCHAVISYKYPQLNDSLKKLDIEPLFVSGCRDILPQVEDHSDMLFSYIGDGCYMLEKSQAALDSSLKMLGFKSINSRISLSAGYPHDVVLNTCIIGNKILGSEAIADYRKDDSKNFVAVKQGYAKCSVCVVDENSLITDDISIFNKCKSLDMDVLFVRKGSVKLNGFDYGFIGGCCGKIARDVLAFFGDINTHSDSSKIKSFLSFRGIDAFSLCPGDLKDIGSIIPITEYCS